MTDLILLVIQAVNATVAIGKLVVDAVRHRQRPPDR